MKYFKFAQVSDETGVSWVLSQPLSGPRMPFIELPGLTNVIQLAQPYFVGQANNEAEPNPDNFIFELTFSEYVAILKQHVEDIISDRLKEIYEEENIFRRGFLSKYDLSATVAGIYKYDQAKALVADNTAAAEEVRSEATRRGIDPVVLANKIITKHEEFRAADAKIAGIRGMIKERLNGFVFNESDPDTSYNDLVSSEVIGTRTRRQWNSETNQEEDIEINVEVGKYTLSISDRFDFAD